MQKIKPTVSATAQARTPQPSAWPTHATFYLGLEQKETAPGDGGGISVIFRREVASFCDFFAIFAEKYKKMKKLCFISMMCLLALFVVSLAGCKKEEVNNNGNNNDNGGSGGGVNAQTDYVDLGLPSGTKWRYTNETPPVFGEMYFTYDEAVSSFGDKLPTKEQFEELKDNCTWEWQGDYGYKVTGPNGNSIVLYDLGYRNCEGFVINVSAGYYWSYTPNGSDDAWGLYFNSGVVNVGCDHRCSGFTVRLVQD